MQNRSARARRLTFKDRIAEAKKTRDLRNPPRISLRSLSVLFFLFHRYVSSACPSFFSFFFPSDVNSSPPPRSARPSHLARSNANVNLASSSPRELSSRVESDRDPSLSGMEERNVSKQTRPDRCRAIAAFHREFLREFRSLLYAECPRSKRGGEGRKHQGTVICAFLKGRERERGRKEMERDAKEIFSGWLIGKREERRGRRTLGPVVHQSVFRSVGRWFAFSVRETRLRYACSMHALTDSRGERNGRAAARRSVYPVYTRTRLSGVEGAGGRGGRVGRASRRHADLHAPP